MTIGDSVLQLSVVSYTNVDEWMFPAADLQYSLEDIERNRTVYKYF